MSRNWNWPSPSLNPWRVRAIAYWFATALLVFELCLGGVWDILRVPQVRGVIERLGYPPYVLGILGVWKLLGAVALAAPAVPATKGVGVRRGGFRPDRRNCVTLRGGLR
jgi:hypothetical protein